MGRNTGFSESDRPGAREARLLRAVRQVTLSRPENYRYYEISFRLLGSADKSGGFRVPMPPLSFGRFRVADSSQAQVLLPSSAGIAAFPAKEFFAFGYRSVNIQLIHGCTRTGGSHKGGIRVWTCPFWSWRKSLNYGR